MTYLLTALLLAQFDPGSPGNMITEPVHPAATQVHSNDDVIRSYGGTVGAEDYWCEHDTAATPDEFACWTTDADSGGGTDGKWMSIPDGGDDVVYSGGATWGDDLDVAGNDLKNLDDLWSDAAATDAAPRATVLTSQPIYVAPGATNVTGARTVVTGSPGENTLDGVTKAASTGDTLTFSVYSNGVLTTTVKTEGAASPDGWDCDGAATDIICVCNLYDLLVGAGAIAGVTVTRTDATCSDESLTFTITPGTSDMLYVVTSDDTNVDMTNGAAGEVWLQGRIVYLGMPGQGMLVDLTVDGKATLTTEAPGNLNVTIGGDFAGKQLTASSHVFAGAASSIQHLGRTSWTSSDDGVWEMGKNAGDQGWRVNVATTANWAYVTDENGNPFTVAVANLAAITPKGALTTNTTGVESVTFQGGGGDASKVTVGSLIPDGSILDGITTRVTTADNGGACTGYTVGDGADIDLYGVAATETQGTTTTPASATATLANPQFGGPYEVTITGTGGNCIDMVVRITAHYRLLTADTTL